MIKLKLHSTTDLITNSSTVIFTYSEGTDTALRKMFEEIIKTFIPQESFLDSKLSFDDMFSTVILCEDEHVYSKYISDLSDEDLPEGITSETNIKQLYNDVRDGKIAKPNWFNTAEEMENDYDYYRDSTYLYLIPKDEKYREMGNLIKSFLYSTGHEATRDD